METTSIFRILYIADYTKAETAINQMQARIAQQENALRKLSSVQGVATQQTDKMGQAMGNAGIPIQNLNKHLGEVPAHLNRMHAGFGQMIISGLKWAVVFTAIYTVIRGIISVVGDLLKTTVKLDQSLKDIASVGTIAGAGLEKTLGSFRKAILSYAADSRESIEDVAKSIYVLQQAGVSAEDSMAGFQAVMDLVTATMGNVGETTEMVAGVYNTLSSHVEGATTAEEKFRAIADVLAYTIQKEQVTIGQMVQGLSYIAPEASALTDTFTELATVVGFLNTHMLKGSKSGMLTSQALQQIVKNAEKLAQILGITFDPNKPLNFLDTVGKIRDAMHATNQLTFKQREVIADVFQTRGARPIMLMIQGWDELQAKIKAAKLESTGFAEAMKEMRMGTIESRGKELANSFRNIFSTFLEATKPASEVAADLKTWSEWIDKAVDSAETFGLMLRWLRENADVKYQAGAAGRRAIAMMVGATLEANTGMWDFINANKGKAQDTVSARRSLKDVEKEIKDFIEGENELLTEQSKLSEDRMKFELKLVDSVLQQELNVMKEIGKSEEEVAQARIDYLEATAGLRSADEQILSVLNARFDLEDAILGKIKDQQKAYDDQLQAIDRNAEAIEALLATGKEGEDIIKYLLGQVPRGQLNTSQAGLLAQLFPKEAASERVTQELIKRGLLQPPPAMPTEREGIAPLVSRAEAIAKEIANITINQKNESAINIGGVTIDVQPGMSAEQIGNLVKEKLEQVYRDRQSIIKKITDEGMSEYK